MLHGHNKNVPKSGSTVFTTPENSHFYSKMIYSALDPTRPEIRLLQLHPKLLKPADLPKVFPHWIKHGTDAYRLQEPTFRVLIVNQEMADRIDLPGRMTGKIRDDACRQLIKPLPKGWRAVSFNRHLENDRHAGRYHDDYLIGQTKPLLPDILYFVNCYTGKSQWQLPTKDAPEAPPDMTNTFMACELHSKVSLPTMSGKYTALSYCAGSSKETTKIMINGMWFNAFANLEHSLQNLHKHMQQSQGSKTKLLIWTDQVCIDQSNPEEKSSQVALMKQIYHQAEHVFVCLSTASNTPALLTLTPNGIAALRAIFYESLTSIPTELKTTAHIQKTLFSHFTELLKTEAELPQLKLWFEFFQHIVSVPWWTRAWVYQEFIVASRAYFLCGSHCLSWPEISPFLTFFCSTLSNEFGDPNGWRSVPKATQSRNQSPSAENNLFQPIGEMSMSKEASIPQTAHSLIEHIGTSLKGVEAHRKRVLYFVKSKMERTGEQDLRSILERAVYFNSTDPRDLVYAFVGLVKSSETIYPDYSKENTICHILIAAAKKLLASEHMLTILDDALIRGRSGECMRLPSWVPDYTSPVTIEPEVLKELITGPGPEFQASKDSQARAMVSKFQGNLAHAKLKTLGLRVDSLASVVSDAYDWSCTFMTLSGLKVITTSHARVGDTLWVLFGGRTVYLLRQPEEDYCLISAASLYEKVDDAIWEPSNIMYGKLMNQTGVVEESISIR